MWGERKFFLTSFEVYAILYVRKGGVEHEEGVQETCD